MKYLIVVAILGALVFSAGCTTTPGEQAYSNPHPVLEKGAVTDNTLKQLVFPKDIAGIPFRSIEIYEANHPGYGVGYLYEDEDTKLDISVFDGGYDEIADGIFFEGVHHFYEETKQNIVAMESKGYYTIKQIVTDDWIQVGGQPFLYFNFTYHNGHEEKSSYLMMTGYDGNFLKVRLTTDNELDTQVFDAFMADFASLISSTMTS